MLLTQDKICDRKQPIKNGEYMQKEYCKIGENYDIAFYKIKNYNIKHQMNLGKNRLSLGEN